MITTLTLSLLLAQPASDLSCPVMGGGVSNSVKQVEYAGATYGFCCAGCDTKFTKNPQSFLKASAKKSKAVGSFAFDPVSRVRLDLKDAKFSAVHQGIAYPFSTEANLKTFRAKPAQYTTHPKFEAMVCPVSHEPVASFLGSAAYVDSGDTRWYFCCADCIKSFDASKSVPAEVKAMIKAPAAREIAAE